MIRRMPGEIAGLQKSKGDRVPKMEERRSHQPMFTKSVVAHMELAARREPPGEGEDPVGVHCITF